MVTEMGDQLQYYPFSSLFGILQCKLEALTENKRQLKDLAMQGMCLPVQVRNNFLYI